MPSRPQIRSIGLFGFGAFGQLTAAHLAPHLPVTVFDPQLAGPQPLPDGARAGTLEQAAACSLVILAVPVSALPKAAAQIAPHLRPGAIVADTGSVKLAPAKAMLEHIPEHASLVGTHPLFGPQSARQGIRGCKIALCPLRGRAHLHLAAWLRARLGLKVLFTTPEAHDREVAAVQGLTHMIARVLRQMEPLPSRMTTASFELLMQAAAMVRDDPPGVLAAIEQSNPFASTVRSEFLRLAQAADADRAGNGSG
ncbi:prephenate dehydrogenase/arogenate dehydrogenase family protein [Roseobacteraceae bacterium NS-SX3]